MRSVRTNFLDVQAFADRYNLIPQYLIACALKPTCCVHIYSRFLGSIFLIVSPFHFPFNRGKWYHRPNLGTPPAMAAKDDYVFTRDLLDNTRLVFSSLVIIELLPRAYLLTKRFPLKAELDAYLLGEGFWISYSSEDPDRRCQPQSSRHRLWYRVCRLQVLEFPVFN